MFLQFNATGDVTWPKFRRFESIAERVVSGHPNLQSDYLRSLHRMVAAQVPHANVHLTRLRKYLGEMPKRQDSGHAAATYRFNNLSRH